MENCLESLVKYIMIFWNILFTIFGCILIGVGVWIKSAAKDYIDFLGHNYSNTPLVLIVIGGIIFVVAFYGCCGSWMEQSWMMKTYAGFLVIILIAQVGTGIAAYVFKGNLNTTVTKNMNDAMKGYNTTQVLTETWDLVQSNLHCCGVDGQYDWPKERKDMFPNNTTPDSCCNTKDHKAGCGMETKIPKYGEGCLQLFKQQFIAHIPLVGGVALGLAVAEFLIVLVACCLAERMKAEQGERQRLLY